MLQTQSWQRESLVEVTTRPLAYRHDGSAMEKGIDVALAVDVVAMAMADEFDIGIGLGLSQPWCHVLDRSCYDLVADGYNYASQKSRRR